MRGLKGLPGRSKTTFYLYITCIVVMIIGSVGVLTYLVLPTHAETSRTPGINLDSISDKSPAFVFTDVIKQSRRWGTVEKPYDGRVPLDKNGWPLRDAATIAITLERPGIAIHGTYKLSFTGQARIRAYNSRGNNYSVTKQVYNNKLNTTTAEIQVPKGATELWLAFTASKRAATSAVNTGITNVKCIRPGYPAGGAQVFTRPFLDSFKLFQSIRTTNFTLTNNSEVSTWANRVHPTYASMATYGVAWEYVIQLANMLNKDVWINIPHQATNDYVTQLALLFKNSLRPNLHLYVEYSNEVWRPELGQAVWNYKIAQTDTSLQWDKAKNTYQLATRRVGKRIAEISVLFRNVYGAAAINTIVRPVLAWQVGNTWGLNQQLATIRHFYGEPRQYIYGLATAPYMHVGDGMAVSQNTSSVEAILQGLYADSNRNRQSMETVTLLAHNNGLKHLAYAGGPALAGKSGFPARLAASRDIRIKDVLLHDIGTNWYGTGGDMYMYFNNFSTYNQYGMWGLSENVFDTNTPKWQALRQVISIANTVPPTPTATTKATAGPAGSITATTGTTTKPVPTATTPGQVLDPPFPNEVNYVSELDWSAVTDGIGGEPSIDESRSGNRITINGQVYSRGLGVHANSTIVYPISGYKTFLSDIGVDDECSIGTVRFLIYVDGIAVFDSGVVRGHHIQNASISIANKKELKLVVTDAGDGSNCDHADWANARVVA